MTGPVFTSPDINPEDYPFFTGKVAMSENFLWSTYGLEGLDGDWDMAALPSYNGTDHRRRSTPTRSGSSRTPSTRTRRSRC